MDSPVVYLSRPVRLRVLPTYTIQQLCEPRLGVALPYLAPYSMSSEHPSEIRSTRRRQAKAARVLKGCIAHGVAKTLLLLLLILLFPPLRMLVNLPVVLDQSFSNSVVTSDGSHEMTTFGAPINQGALGNLGPS